MVTMLMSIKPKYVEKIFSGIKKYEYRTIKCKIIPDRIIIYSTSPVKKVVGELIIEKVLFDKKENIWKLTHEYSGTDEEGFNNYFKNREYAVAYKIKEFKKYNTYKDLSDYGVKCVPQSYIYLDDKIEKSLQI